jgi:cytochrome P450
VKYVPSWFPGAGFKRTAASWRETLTEMSEMPHRMVKQAIENGTAVPSFTQELLESKSSLSDFTHEEEETIKWAAASMYSGGADTTVSAIATFFLAMVMYPDVVKKAQEELDRVVGGERLPSFKDRGKLPYIEAICKEVFRCISFLTSVTVEISHCLLDSFYSYRWGPVVPVCVPHVSTKDDVYEGYRIPKGSLVCPNIFGITHDESIYPDPDAFKPERFLNADVDSNQIIFGYGRRICPGMNLADLSIWISVAMTLSVFDISEVKGEPAKFKYTSGTIS